MWYIISNIKVLLMPQSLSREVLWYFEMRMCVGRGDLRAMNWVKILLLANKAGVC